LYLVLIDVYSSYTNDEKNSSKIKDNKMPMMEKINFEEYNDIIQNILKNMNTEILSKEKFLKNINFITFRR
jgi:hypothetical protein